LHRFDTDHECDRRTDRRPDDGKDARSILLSRVKMTERRSYAESAFCSESNVINYLQIFGYK